MGKEYDTSFSFARTVSVYDRGHVTNTFHIYGMRNEFNGVVRFFFRGDDGKYQSKCIRITNTDTARYLVNILVEKFHPDLRMLTAGRYAIYEYHTNNGERRLGADEAPLLVQLNWTAENQEGRFILRDESKPQTITRPDSTYQNGSATIITSTSTTHGLKQRKDNKNLLTTQNNTDDKQTRGFVRRWSSGSRKKQRKSSKNRSDLIDDELEQIPDTTFTRTLSNPDEVLRRRRQQRIHNRNQCMDITDGNKRGSLVKIYGSSLNPTIPYILLPISTNDTAEQIVLWTLEKYNLISHVDPRDYCLVMVNLPLRGGAGVGGSNHSGMNGVERLPQGVDKEITLHDKDCVLKFREMIRSNSGVSNIIQIRHRYAVGKDGKRPPLTSPAYSHVPTQQVPISLHSNSSSSSSSCHNHKDGKQLRQSQQLTDMPYLVEVNGDLDHSIHPNGFTIDLTDLFTRAYTLPIKLGTVESMVGPYPNVLINKTEHPDIRPVHCTFCVVLTTNQITTTTSTVNNNDNTTTTNNNNTSNTAQKWKLPKSVSTPDLENFANYSLLLTPSLDGFAKPPGPALIRVNGTRVTGPILISNNAILQLGKTLYLKYIQPIQTKSLNSLINDNNKMQIKTENVNKIQQTITKLPSSSTSLSNRLAERQIDLMNEKNQNDDVMKLKKDRQFSGGTLSKAQTLKSVPNFNRNSNSNPSLLIKPLTYWLGNSSELLHFFKNDIDLCSNHSRTNRHQNDQSGSIIQSVICRDALHLLAETVDHCFYYLRSIMYSILQPWLPCLTYPGDLDLQACQLIMANRTNLDEFYQQCISLISLNSIQLEWLLAHLSDPPPVPDEWIDLIVTGAKEVNDRAYADEIEHYNINTGQSDHTLSELQLNELKELPIPLLLPADGYVSDAVLSGIPDGLLDFLHPLIKTGLIKVKKHSIVNGQIENRPWTNCMRLSMAEGHRLYGIYIKDIVPNGAADQDGRLKTGDQILIIGNTNLIGCAQSDAVAKISKQNKSDDGIQMIIAKKAAQYHKIVELIKSRTTTNSMNNNMNHDSRYLQSTELPSSENKHRVYDLLHFNQSQPDLRIQTQQDHNAMNNPSRNTTDKKATRNHHSSSHRHHHYTQQQTDIDKPDNIHTSRPNHHRIDKSKQLDKSKQKIGSLSRSTPSLNLAQVGMDDDMIELDDNENYTDNNAVSNHSPKRSMRSRNRISEKTNRPQSVGSRSGTQVNQQHIQSSSLSFSTTSSESDIIVNEPGEGIEQYHNRESSFRNDYLPTRQQQSEDYRRTESPIKSFKQKYKSHKPSNSPLLSSHHMHENSHSQPNILKNVCNDNQDNTDTVDGKHSPVNSSSYPPLPHQQNHYQDERPRPIVESISNDLSSLESVTSQQTVCSLNESQPITDSYDNIQNKTNSNEHRRIRHQPPPPPPQSNPSLNHNASKTDLIMNKKDGRNEKPTWRETDLDHFTIRNHQHHQDNNHNDEDKNEWNRYKSNENRNNSSINCDNSNEISNISTRPYQSNETNQLKMENNNNTMPPYKSIGHDRIPQYTSDYRKYDLLGNSTSVQKTASYISTSSYPNQSSSIQFSDSDKFNPVSSQNNRLNMEVHNTSPTYPRPITTPSYVPSPPPVPTAEYPQYHPPERLEPVHWSTYKHCSSTNESHLSPMSTNPINVQSPTTNSSLKPMDQLTNMPDSDSNYPPPLSKYSNKPVVFRSSSPTSSAASRVIAIQSEIAELEAQQRVDSRLDLSSTLDRLRVELQFQKRLAERESNCRTSVNNNISTSNNSIIKETRNYSIPEKSNTLESSQSRSSLSISNTNHSNDQDWVRKRNQAEQELLETSLSLPRNAETVNDDVKSWNYQNLSQVPLRQSSEDNISQTSTSQNRYGRPRFDNHNNKTEISKSISYSLQHPIQSRLGPQIIESDLNRLQIISGTTGSSVESIRVKKSVSFDKNLETISVYSPPTTPHGSFIEHGTMHKSQMPNISLTSGPKNSLNSSSVNSSYKKSLSPPIGFEIDDKTNDKSHQTNRTNPNHSVPRSSSQGKLATNNTPPTVTVKPPPNAELLPFKEKMRLFAQQIGEDLPKERIKASSRQRELQSANNLH
ncbi:afadin (af-6 protein), putative [Schistosoma mansoni]|uniref:afadin (af-6 protein), putative n=1 Tax=Schistosoma mansoni TaxID=6183 RepID=UPI00022C857F|nr:afadin (af-6 protein), putative [Schistosoma mansoni]|eukprot:XP_018646961.1 afadin (af-6 protein), putative [Schistosoma mansoni]